ncbi:MULTISPECIES: lipase family protein [Paenibacillus]|uniref:Lipase family protein n=1 Tax=Paenibacillus alvei TaxID=44250 RepID=A0ABT4EC45_PAEAL|nr:MULTISPECIES: lipase family protein [Paenibacillus]MCY9530213.1 lipase family protein [Paenibacillus alvei]
MKESKLEHHFDAEDAILLSAMIHQAYQLFAQEPFVLPKGFSVSLIIRALAGVEEPEEEVFGYIAQSSHRIIVVFRGTRTFKDNESDQDLYQIPYPFVPESGRTHRGFTCIYHSARVALIRELSKLFTSKTLFVTGHSLGGALAVLAAYDIAVNTPFTKPIVYTYGSPRVASPTFASKFDLTVKNSIRIVNIHDIIPTLPERSYPPPFTKDGITYEHVKTKYPISFQLNSLANRNHEIVCYFKNLSKKNPYYASLLCEENPGLCPDTSWCVPFKGICSPVEEEG